MSRVRKNCIFLAFGAKIGAALRLFGNKKGTAFNRSVIFLFRFGNLLIVRLGLFLFLHERERNER